LGAGRVKTLTKIEENMRENPNRVPLPPEKAMVFIETGAGLFDSLTL
jgi:hypothetical protein